VNVAKIVPALDNAAMRAELLRILALMTIERPVAEEAGEWALGVLATAEDTEAVRVLAGLPADAAHDEAAPWLRRAARELGVRLPTREESLWILSLSQAQRARDVARAIADGQIGLVEGSWRIRDLAFAGALVDDEMRALFMPFVAVTSETDHLPIGAERANWDTDVLREKDREIRAYDEAGRAEVVPHCRAFAARVDRDAARLTEFFISTPR
jgi:hypothetical protein